MRPRDRDHWALPGASGSATLVGMGILGWFTDPDDIAVVVRWPQPAGAVARSLTAALRSDPEPPTMIGRRHAYRLDGTVTGRRLCMRVSLSMLHIFAGWPSLTIEGDIRDTQAGSEFTGSIEIPGARSRTWVLVIVVLVAILALVPMTDLGPGFVLLVAGLLVAYTVAPALRRRNLRAYAADIELILASLGGAATAPGTAPGPGAMQR